MTGAEHYQAAEKWLENSHKHTDTGDDRDTTIATLSAQQATAHALLAQVAVQVSRFTIDERSLWDRVRP